jgi:hypothetical protein
MATVYKVLDQRDRTELETSINELNNKVYEKEANLQNNIDNLESRHEELKAYAENNKSLIDELTTDKISHSEIVNEVDSTTATSEVARNVPLSAAYGGILYNRDQSLQTQINTNKDSIKTETTRATNAEAGLDSRLQTVENDINTFLENADLSETAKDTLREIQDYIDSDVESAAQMTASIQANADAISDETTRATNAETELNINKINYSDIVNTLSSSLATDESAATVPLSAAQGGVLFNRTESAISLAGEKVAKADIADNLTTTDATKVLSAKQGNVLDTKKVNVSDIVNDLTTGGINVPLSAEQGKLLNSNLSTIAEARILKASIVDNLTTDDATKVLSARQGKLLNDNKINYSDIVNTLTDDLGEDEAAGSKPLSAKQGGILYNRTRAAITGISEHNTSTDAHSDIRTAIGDLSDTLTEMIPKTDIANDLTTEDANKVLSANQGAVLDTKKINYSDIVDTLTADLATSEDAAGVPLSAKQGGILYNRTAEAIRIAGEKVAKTDIIDDLTTADATKVLSANQGAVLYGLIQELIERVNALDGGGSTTE